MTLLWVRVNTPENTSLSVLAILITQGTKNPDLSLSPKSDRVFRYSPHRSPSKDDQIPSVFFLPCTVCSLFAAFLSPYGGVRKSFNLKMVHIMLHDTVGYPHDFGKPSA